MGSERSGHNRKNRTNYIKGKELGNKEGMSLWFTIHP